MAAAVEAIDTNGDGQVSCWSGRADLCGSDLITIRGDWGHASQNSPCLLSGPLARSPKLTRGK